jgi:hypothetical protein
MFEIISIIILFAINIQNFDTNLTNQVFAVDKPTKELQEQSNSTSLSNAQIYALGSPYVISKAPYSTEGPNFVQGGGDVLGTGSGSSNSNATESKSPSSKAETNVLNNPANPTSTNCGSDPRLLIACNNIPPSNTNCGINPHAAPCCVEPSTCNKDSSNPANPTSTNCGSDPRLLIACNNIPPSNTNCGINPHATPCCIQPITDKSCIKDTNPSNPNNINNTKCNDTVLQVQCVNTPPNCIPNHPGKTVSNTCDISATGQPNVQDPNSGKNTSSQVTGNIP